MKTEKYAVRERNSLGTLAVVLCISLVSPAFGQISQKRSPDDQTAKPPVSVQSYNAANAISPMPLAERIRRGIVPKRGFVSTGVNGGTLLSGDGKMMVETNGSPLAEEIMFHHERLLQPWKVPAEAPKISNVLPQVRQLILAGHYREALELSFKASTDAGQPPGLFYPSAIPAFTMHIETPEAGTIKDYLRSVDFESGEIKVRWTDDRGDWLRQTFVSRPDNVAVQYLAAPQGKTLDTSIAITTGGRDRPNASVEPPRDFGPGGAFQYERDFNEHRLIVTGHTTPDFGDGGYASVTRVIPSGGSVHVENGNLVIRGVQSMLLLTRVEWFDKYNREQADVIASAVDRLPASYETLLAKHRTMQSEIIDRMSMNFGGQAQQGMSSEELLTDQRSRIGYSPALLEQYFDMCRYWLLAEGTGVFPSIEGHLNVNVNLQIAPAAMEALPEATQTFTHWIESLMPDSRKNAENIFGTQGALFSVHPDQQTGVLYHFAYNWPHHYWISAGGWAYSPLWDYYLTTGDRDFLRDHIVPGLKELALFYQGFLSETDQNGNYIFVPSYSPENWPLNSDSAPTVINAVMDISVCKEVLTHLIEASQVLGTDADLIPKWKAMLEKMPPYLVDNDGALKEWAWPALEENQDHRHASHLYGVWPADEIDPDRTPALAKAAWLADRKRAQGNASGHGISHRALAAARLKDSYLVNMELKQFLEQGYVGPTLRGAHNPYNPPQPDQQGSIPTIMMEMLMYSRQGVIEPLPALPPTLTTGDVKGMLVRSFAKIDDLSWNMNTRSLDLTITSLQPQDITLIVRYGIEAITAPSGVLSAKPKADATRCVLHLPGGRPVSLHVKLGNHQPSEWVLNVPPMIQ